MYGKTPESSAFRGFFIRLEKGVAPQQKVTLASFSIETGISPALPSVQMAASQLRQAVTTFRT
ncbi:hypothetical protein [Pyruvatibacter mobilis]|uniref:hypothetical protein n=1 Tax=Pyruvatibacter mobilis TaxID=1712261 RepID=UPI000489C180